MREIHPCVYMLSSKYNGRLYFGVTSNMLARIVQHREGVFDGFAKRYGIKRLVWFEMADTMEAAIASEKRMKKWHRDWTGNLIERGNPTSGRPRGRPRPRAAALIPRWTPEQVRGDGCVSG